jgi:thiamine-monophosphate kinase
MKESEILARIRATFLGGQGLTDDCGAIPSSPSGQHLLVTTDLMEEDQHFCREWHPPALLAKKLLMANLSDLDASGARPVGYTLTLALSKTESDDAWVHAFLDGLAAAARVLKIPILGGDTVGRPQGLGFGMTAFGHAERWLRRDGLQVGDSIYVDQPLGRSLRGLRKLQAGERWTPENPDQDLQAHLAPEPNLGLGLKLATLSEVHACIDISDGLSKDLRLLAEASQLSIQIAELDEDSLRGGEDYARCFGSSLSLKELESKVGLPLICVGHVIAKGVHPLFSYDGRSPLPDLSFDHFNP